MLTRSVLSRSTASTTNIDPLHIAVDAFGDVYFSDYGNARIRKLSISSEVISTLVGTGITTYNGDGTGTATNISPWGVAVDAAGVVAFTDAQHLIRTWSPTSRLVATIAGTGTYSDIDEQQNGNGNGAALSTEIQTLDLAVDPRGDVYFSEVFHGRVRKLEMATGLIVAVAGTGHLGIGGDGGPANQALLNGADVEINGMDIDQFGHLLIADSGNRRIRSVVIDTSPVYNPVSPERLLDTRDGVGAPKGMWPAGNILELQVTGAGATAVPAAASAVVLNVTVVSPTADGFATVWPCGSPQPTASNLNYRAGETIPNLVTAKLGSGGKVCIASQSTAHLLADVNGWFAATLIYRPVSPERLLDTRDGVGAPKGKLPASSVLELQVTGAGVTNVAATATAVVLNVTAVSPDGDGFATVWPCGSPMPTASNLNFAVGQTIANLVIAKLGVGGKVCIFSQATTHLLADVNGWYAAGLAYRPVSPERVLDSRDGVGAPKGKLPAGSILELQVTGAGVTNIPATASAVVLNITVVSPDAAGFLTVWPCGSPRPTASNVNYSIGETIANLVIAKLGTGGKVCIASQSTAHVLADINGWHI